MAKRKTSAGAWVALAFVVLVPLGLRGYMQTLYEPEYEISDQAKTNTEKRGFISGCTSEGASDSECGCMYDKLKASYPDVFEKESIEKITAEGYSQEQVDTVMACME